MTLSVRAIVSIAIAIALALAAAFTIERTLGGWQAVAIAVLVAIPLTFASARAVTRPMRRLHDDLGNALRATRDGDHGLRLVVRGAREAAELRRLYNELADAVRLDRQAIHDKEILLDTILQRTPMGVALLNGAGRVIYSNAAARELLANGARIDGRLIDEIAQRLTPAMREALAGRADALFKLADETFQITQRAFRLQVEEHRLLLMERLTPELRRQEVAVWKTAIRVINHEINNTVAPISSLFHSARRAQEMPEHRHRLTEIYELIDERLAFLRSFLEAYAEFARLPEPRKERTPWVDVFEAVRLLYPFRVEGTPALECNVDRAQIEQVLINLVKNAHESASAPEDIVVSVQRAGDDCVVRVMDRGKGMSDEVMRQALVPFYSTKPGGSGVGLALANEVIDAHGGRMRLHAREGGGTTVTCWIPIGL